MPEKPLDDQLGIRINSDDKLALVEKCDKLGSPYQVMLREFITAFTEDRLRIVVPKETLNKGGIYVTGK